MGEVRRVYRNIFVMLLITYLFSVYNDGLLYVIDNPTRFSEIFSVFIILNLYFEEIMRIFKCFYNENNSLIGLIV